MRAELVAEWVREGLDEDEQVLWIAPDAQVFDWLSAHNVAWEEAHRRGQLAVVPPCEIVRLESLADIPARLAHTGSLTVQAVADGYTSLRIGAEAANALAVMPDAPSQFHLETAWEQHTAATGMSFLCLYDPGVYGADIERAVALHPRCLTDGLVLVTETDGVVHLAGEVDVSNVDLLGHYLAAVARDGAPLDLSQLSFIDVRGTRELVRFSRSLAPRRLPVTATSPALERVLELTGWDGEFEARGGRKLRRCPPC